MGPRAAAVDGVEDGRRRLSVADLARGRSREVGRVLIHLHRRIIRRIHDAVDIVAEETAGNVIVI